MVLSLKGKRYLIGVILVLFVTAALEMLMGRVVICECGYIKVWQGQTNSSENSQHLTDFYTFSHIIHGFIFFLILKRVARKLPFEAQLLLAVLIESVWELVENSSFIINRYRTATISLDYYGDSVINSLVDILAMVGGFYLARKLKLWMIIALILIMELGVGYLIRDNLTLNIIMLFFPIQAIKNWQSGI